MRALRVIRSTVKIASEIRKLESALQEVSYHQSIISPPTNAECENEYGRYQRYHYEEDMDNCEEQINDLETEIEELSQKQRRLKRRANRIKKRNVKKAKRAR